MQMFEWAVSIGTAGRSPVGVTDTAPRAQSRMLEALGGTPHGVSASGWVTLLAYGPDRLSYDRLDVLARVRRDEQGSIRWLEGADLAQSAAAGDSGQAPGRAGLPPRTTVIDGQRLRELRRQCGLSREALAWKAGLGITTVARLESQPRPPCRMRTVARLAAALGGEPGAIISVLVPGARLTSGTPASDLGHLARPGHAEGRGATT
jgi:DNA-binding XRE family transcriptional regulator